MSVALIEPVEMTATINVVVSINSTTELLDEPKSYKPLITAACGENHNAICRK